MPDDDYALTPCSKLLHHSLMANGVPVRLSESLTVRARTAAAVLDRSLTEQVEHWARLGQAVEAAISATTLHALKARSYDHDLDARLAVADTPAGRAAAAKLIRARHPANDIAAAAGAPPAPPPRLAAEASDPALRITALRNQTIRGATAAARKRSRRTKSR
jgi:hypothetical protein